MGVCNYIEDLSGNLLGFPLYYEHSWFDFGIYNLDLTSSYNQLFTYRDPVRSRFLIYLSINLSPWWKTHREFYLKMKIMSYEIILLVINKTLSSVMRYLCIYSTYEVGLYNENWLTPCFGRQAQPCQQVQTTQTPVDITQTIIRSIMAKFRENDK